MSCRKNVLYLFDVDGTLTKPRQKIAEEVKKFLFNKVKPKVFLGLVSGSDHTKILQQMDGTDVISNFDYVFCENGLVYYKNNVLQSSQSILSHLGEQKLQKLINFSLGYMSGIELPAKRGTFIEFRSGLINICPVGRSCSQAERDQFSAFDTQHQVRETFRKALKKEFDGCGLTFALGGQISIDVFPTGWDKRYCLNHVSAANFDEIHFFGDKTAAGGNDHEIFSDARTIGHTVASPEDTVEQIKHLLNIS